MQSSIKQCVLALGLVMTTAAGVSANPVSINDGINWVEFNDGGWVNWVTYEGYRVYEKSFKYQTGTMTTPAALHLLPQETPSLPSANRVIRTFADQAGQFKVTLDQSVSSTAATTLSSRSTLKTLVKVENLTATPIKFNLSEISSYAITNYFDTSRDNVAVTGNRSFFSNFIDIPLNSQPKGAMVSKTSTLNDVAQSSFIPTAYSIADCANGTIAGARICAPSPSWPMPQNGRPELTLKWNLDVPANGSFSFNITDNLLPAYPMKAAATHAPTCSAKKGKVTYTISVDNYANNNSQTNVTAANAKVSTVLPSHVTFVSATNGGVYNTSTRTVTWNIGSMTPQTAAKTMQLTVSNSTDKNIDLKVQPLSDNLYPNIAIDTAKSCTNTAPTFITPMFGISARMGFPFTYQVNATDPNGDKINYSLSCTATGCPGNMKIDPVSGLISGVATDPALMGRNLTFYVYATDDRGTKSQLGATLNPINNVPAFSANYPTAAYAGQNYTYQVKATDADGHTLTFSFPGTVPVGMTMSTSGLISWNPTVAQYGNATVAVRVSDSWATKDQNIVFGVLNPVSITSTQPLGGAKVGNLYTYQVVAANALNKPVSYMLTAGPAGMTITNSGLISWTPTAGQVGSFAVSIKVTDGVAEATQSYYLTSFASDLPYFISTPPTQATVGQQYVYNVILGNVGSAYVGCVLNTAPAGMTATGLNTYIPGAGQVLWTPTADQANTTYSTLIWCSDIVGHIFTQDLTITVNP